MYVSLLGISGALYLSVFEQPASRVFFSILLEREWWNTLKWHTVQGARRKEQH
jgi:hypothetical protein